MALGTRFGYPTLLLAGLIVVLGIAFVVAASTSTAAFSTYNAAWDGAADLEAQADAVGVESAVVLNTTAYESAEPGGTVALVLSPGAAYEGEDAARVRAFVRDGGTLVVADDYGRHGNALLEAVGASARFEGDPVRDDRHAYRSPAMPVATNVSEAAVTSDVAQLTLNHGTVVEPNGAAVLVRTSEYAYLDRNGDGVPNQNESLESYPVVTTESLGAGRVVVVSDPSLFINAMQERQGNQRFTRNLFSLHDRVLLDYSHMPGLPPLALAALVLRRSPLLQVLAGFVGVGAVTLWLQAPSGRLLGRFRGDEESTRSPQDPEALVSMLRQRHPDWSETRLRRVMAGVLTHEGEVDDDE